MREVELKVLDSLASVAPAEWDALTEGNPTLRHAYLQSMIDAGCTTAETGWLPQFLTLWREVDGREEEHMLVEKVPYPLAIGRGLDGTSSDGKPSSPILEAGRRRDH